MELIPIREEEGIQLVDARTLHAFLGVGRHFAAWIKERINKYGFIEDSDYITHYPNPGNESTNNLRAPIDYGLTLDMAKQLCMVENNSQGMQARKYFIECEKGFKQLTARSALPATYSEALRMLADKVDEAERTQQQLQLVSGQLVETEQDRQVLQHILDPQGYIRLGDAAKIIGNPHVGANGIFRFLVGEGILIKTSRQEKPYSFYAKYDQYFKLRATRQNGGHFNYPYTQVVVNFAGVKWIIKRLSKAYGPWNGLMSTDDIVADISSRFQSIAGEKS
ncbi:MAG: antA/AntB antirepressor family protein [Dehalococcoidia bacterium]|jgi:anti-repressor protein